MQKEKWKPGCLRGTPVMALMKTGGLLYFILGLILFFSFKFYSLIPAMAIFQLFLEPTSFYNRVNFYVLFFIFSSFYIIFLGALAGGVGYLLWLLYQRIKHSFMKQDSLPESNPFSTIGKLEFWTFLLLGMIIIYITNLVCCHFLIPYIRE